MPGTSTRSSAGSERQWKLRRDAGQHDERHGLDRFEDRPRAFLHVAAEELEVVLRFLDAGRIDRDDLARREGFLDGPAVVGHHVPGHEAFLGGNGMAMDGPVDVVPARIEHRAVATAHVDLTVAAVEADRVVGVREGVAGKGRGRSRPAAMRQTAAQPKGTSP